MITLITGVPGAGKTLRAVQLISQEVDKGRKVYARIDGLQIDGVSEAPTDWRDTPDGSLVVYDEAQQIFPAHGRGGRSDQEFVNALEVHRHTGHDLILVTQHPSLIHNNVRRLVGRHEHLARGFGHEWALLYRAESVFNPDSASEKKRCQVTRWKYPRELYSVYHSANVHTVEKRIPLPVKIGLWAVVILLLTAIGSGAYYWSHRESVAVTQSVSQHVSRETLKPAVSQTQKLPAVVIQTKTPLMGCILMGARCQCWDINGRPVDLILPECRRQVETLRRVILPVGDAGAARERGASVADG